MKTEPLAVGEVRPLPKRLGSDHFGELGGDSSVVSVEGLPIKAIFGRLGISRNAVRRALASDERPKYSRRPWGLSVDAFEASSWEIVAQLRPLFRPPDPPSRTSGLLHE